ncbi:tRNA uridine-5-carboxymethylaminomethyl(34) synthesis GTPase MnmE [Pseudooceanicola aestuarii]|uniref:tRNA uridine-5-carboxymethylaminomethyl(34) synthesis GTPase MnmE n=1 Tax=Pseudooceanicola aestuarii TaxID=2697319 RepID=UPI0013D2A77C|nr:tRNA uridine-5-carboxymethylaminomethyl(34) synthesis GTPase MnmE [Pseudooceanicola aestuarii]
METIFALASAPGRAGVSVIRISGPRAWDVFAAFQIADPPPRVIALRALKDRDGSLLDEALVLRFDAPASFTGENIVELQIHGSPAITTAVLSRLGKLNGFRAAQAGEFTRRALENGRMDLAQVEGLADLIDAETETQRLQAQRILSGQLGDLANGWRLDLIRAASLIEATIDFVDEDVPVDVTPEVIALVERVIETMDHQVRGVSIAERIRSGFEVAILGAPNVGKSTLLNALAGRDAAITSDIAGTTRDVIEVRMDLAGLPVTFLDTAGLRETDDIVETMGIDRARQRAEASDLCVYLVAGGEEPLFALRPGDCVFRTKGDLTGDPQAISAVTGKGLDVLVREISDELRERVAGAGIATRERHRAAMVRSLASLENARGALVANSALADLIAEDIRDAIRALDSLIGAVDVENLLDEIFSSFCIGK